MSAIASIATKLDAAQRNVGCVPILLQKSFCTGDQKFFWP
jgi:hypothetical protein